jgi:NAD(P)-dependent dehydrogenase (short-subunit alcohol dehydrogenase family)
MTVLVTGAAGAIGGAIVKRLVADGREVIGHDLRPVSDVPSIVGDLGDEAALRDALGELGTQLDAVVAAHGVDGSGALAEIDDAFVRRVLTVNTASLPRLLRAVRPYLASPAAFVVVASQAGLVGEGANVAYCASKFAAVGWARAAAEVETDVAIRVLCPGCTESPLLFAAQERFAAAQGMSADDFIAQRRRRIPLERFAAVDETAAAAVYLADPTGVRPTLLAATGGEVLW